MKTSQIPAALILGAVCLACAARAEPQPAVVDLNKPAGESLQPDGVYWTFDDGIVGTSDPKTVEDLSGNGLTATLGGSQSVPVPNYAEGKFSNALFLQGVGSIARWSEKSVTSSQPSNFLTSGAKRQPFTAGIWFKMVDQTPVSHILLRCDGGARRGWRLAVVKVDSKDRESQGSPWRLRIEFGDYKTNPGTRAATDVFADGGWHHVGVSVCPDGEPSQAKDEQEAFTATYWLDGELFDTVSFTSKEVPAEQGQHSVGVGDGALGIVDDAFIASGVHAFKK